MKKISLTSLASYILLLTLLYQASTLASSTETHPSVIISAVQYNPSGPENESEWLTLFNPSSENIDISGWTIAEGTGKYFLFPDSSLIESGQTLLLVNDTSAFQATFPSRVPDIDMSGGNCSSETECLKLNNTAERLTLRNGSPETGEIIDFIAWEGEQGWDLEVGNGEYICRKNSLDTDTFSDFHAPCPDPAPTLSIIATPTPIPTATPTSVPTPTPSPTITPIYSATPAPISNKTQRNKSSGGSNPLIVQRLESGETEFETLHSASMSNTENTPSLSYHFSWYWFFKELSK